ncbi:MAG: 2-amino-4-hydroxy-6-hydroxymethyldihydropteridine diphosphokinase [Gammaproteobacteria bacterium]
MSNAFIALGSNLDNPPEQLKAALNKIATLPKTRLIKTSSFYWNKPVGPQNQPDFLNGVCQIMTEESPEALMKLLLSIETDHNRTREEKDGPRTLDLDLLLYENFCINTPELNIPHPRMFDRSFVLFPLAEIAPDLIFPSGESLQDCIRDLKWAGVKMKGSNLFI